LSLLSLLLDRLLAQLSLRLFSPLPIENLSSPKHPRPEEPQVKNLLTVANLKLQPRLRLLSQLHP
jgi:hypothetical protein